MPKVVHCKKSIDHIYIGRPSIFGNPFPLTKESDRDAVIAKFRKYFYYRLAWDEEFKAKVAKLKGHDLGCWCAPRACHGDIILEYLESRVK